MANELVIDSRYHTDLSAQVQMENTAHFLARVRPERVSGWLIYLLEVLDKDDRLVYDHPSLLEHVRDALNIRLSEGRW